MVVLLRFGRGIVPSTGSVKSRAGVVRHRARRREENPDLRGGAGSASPGPVEDGEPERTGNTALIIGVAGPPPCGLGQPLETG